MNQVRRQTPIIEWHFAESDTEWERLREPQLDSAPPVAHRRLAVSEFLGNFAAILLLLMIVGYWWWHGTHAESHSTQAETQATIQNADSTGSTDWRFQFTNEDSDLRAAVKAEMASAGFDLTVHVLARQGAQAVVSVSAATDGAPVYRQTRFYRDTADGWQQTEPDAALWGPERTLETPSFVFYFRQNDAPAVIAAATQLEALYAALRDNVGLDFLPGGKKQVVEVRVTETPGRASLWFSAPTAIVVASPAIYLAPVELTDTELLVQSIALPLVDAVIAQAGEQYALSSAWQPALRGLRLWQVWNLDLPLAAWRPEVVQWFYTDLPANDPGQPILLPDRYQEICAAHKLWMLSPLQIDIPFSCAKEEQENDYFSLWSQRDLSIHLDQLGVPATPDDDIMQTGDIDRVSYPGRAVLLATLIEYAVVTYGRERLPALVAGLGQYESWDTLLATVYGVSAAEFEAGWQGYLAMHYGG